MGSLVRILAVLERDECLVLVEGEEVNTLQWCLAIVGAISVVTMIACLGVACFQFGEPRK